MAYIYTRTSKSGTVKYYSNLRINGKRIRKYLGNSLANSEIKLKKLEYDILFNSHQPKSKPKKTIASAYISFLSRMENNGITGFSEGKKTNEIAIDNLSIEALFCVLDSYSCSLS